jgi:hypothetical protein
MCRDSLGRKQKPPQYMSTADQVEPAPAVPASGHVRLVCPKAVLRDRLVVADCCRSAASRPAGSKSCSRTAGALPQIKASDIELNEFGTRRHIAEIQDEATDLHEPSCGSTTLPHPLYA